MLTNGGKLISEIPQLFTLQKQEKDIITITITLKEIIQFLYLKQIKKDSHLVALVTHQLQKNTLQNQLHLSFIFDIGF